MEFCNKQLEFKIAGWTAECTAIRSASDPPMMRDVVKLYHRGLDLISRMRDELEQMRDGIVPATSRFSAEPASHTGNHSDPTANAAFRITTLTKQIEEVEQHANGLAVCIRSGITYEVAHKHEREIYSLRVFERLSYTEISSKVGYSESRCRAIVSSCGKLAICMQ